MRYFKRRMDILNKSVKKMVKMMEIPTGIRVGSRAMAEELKRAREEDTIDSKEWKQSTKEANDSTESHGLPCSRLSQSSTVLTHGYCCRLWFEQ